MGGTIFNCVTILLDELYCVLLAIFEFHWKGRRLPSLIQSLILASVKGTALI